MRVTATGPGPCGARCRLQWSTATAALLAVLAGPSASAAALCHRAAASAPTVATLGQALAAGRFVAYQPTALQVVDGRPTRASAATIRADLVALRPRFDGLVTYGAGNGAEAIPEAAAALGFRALIIGVWDPFDGVELDAALDAARRYPGLVVGLSLGNEMAFGKRRTLAELTAVIARIHGREPRLPLSTTEPFHVFDDPAAAALLGEMDFLLANVHPVFQPWFRTASDATAAQFVVNVVNQLGTRYCGPVLVKEVGVPTAPASAGFSTTRQASFFAALRRHFHPTRRRAFAYFSAFDAPWRHYDWHPVPGDHPEEAFWGLYDEHRRPKHAADQLPLLDAPPR